MLTHERESSSRPLHVVVTGIINFVKDCMYVHNVFHVSSMYRRYICYSYNTGPGIMAVNRPSPRAQPKDKVDFRILRCHKSLASCAISIIYPT